MKTNFRNNYWISNIIKSFFSISCSAQSLVLCGSIDLQNFLNCSLIRSCSSVKMLRDPISIILSICQGIGRNPRFVTSEITRFRNIFEKILLFFMMKMRYEITENKYWRKITMFDLCNWIAQIFRNFLAFLIK